MGKTRLTLFLLLASIGLALGQSEDRYVVFFTDKDNTPYSIDAPLEFLTEKAVNRKGRVISEEDLPVDPAYINAVVDAGALFMHPLKWFNGAIVEATSDEIAVIDGLSFVSGYELVAFGTKPNPDGRSNGKTGRGSEGRVEYVQQELLGKSIMHEDGYMGEGLSIAVLDAGFENINTNNYFSHIFDDDRMIMAENIVTKSDDVYGERSSHGSKVLSTIAANIESSYVGMAPMADFYLFITEDADSESPIEEYNWAVAAEKADSAGVDIITTSLGYSTFDNGFIDYTHDDLDGKTAIITQVAEKAFEKGMFVVTSGGNLGNKSWVNVTAPADGEHVLSVGSIGNDLLVSDFSSRGPVVGGRIKPDVVAIGGPAILVFETSIIDTQKGTSYSAPQVAGLVAGLWQKYPEMTNQELFDLLIASSSQANAPDNSYGYGIPNYVRFTNMKEGVTGTDPKSDVQEFLLYPNPLSGTELVIRKAGEPTIDNHALQIYSTNGKLIYNGLLQFSLSTNDCRIPLENVPAGLYLVQIITPLETYSYKLVKQH